MTWESAILIALTVVDVSALAVGLTVLRRVTRLVREAGDEVHRAVVEGIDQAKMDAVNGVAHAVVPVVSELMTQLPRAIHAMSQEVTAAVTVAISKREEEEPPAQ